LFSFLQTSRNTKDCKLRLALANQLFLQRHFDNNPKRYLQDPDALELRHKQEVFVRQDPTTISYTEMHGFNNTSGAMSCGECLRMCFIDGLKENFWRWIYCECFEYAEECYFFTVGVPYDILSALFTIFFPIIAMCMTPREDWTALQEALTFIYISTLFIVVTLSVYVYKFFRLSESVFAPPPTRTKPVVEECIAYWKDFVSTRIRDEVIHNYFGDIAPIIIEMTGHHRVYDTEWIPPLDWDTAGQIEGDYMDWAFRPPLQKTRPGETATNVLALTENASDVLELADKGIYEGGSSDHKVSVAVTDRKSDLETIQEDSEDSLEDKKEIEMEDVILEQQEQKSDVELDPEDATQEFNGSLHAAVKHFVEHPDDRRIVKVYSEFKETWYVNRGEDRGIFKPINMDANQYDPAIVSRDTAKDSESDV